MFISSSPFGPERLLRITMIHVSPYDAPRSGAYRRDFVREGAPPFYKSLADLWGPSF